MVAWFVVVLIAVALQAVSYLLQPKPKKAKPEAAKDLEDPTSEAGIPVIVPFGTVTIKGPNVIGHMDKAAKTYQVNA